MVRRQKQTIVDLLTLALMVWVIHRPPLLTCSRNDVGSVTWCGMSAFRARLLCRWVLAAVARIVEDIGAMTGLWT